MAEFGSELTTAPDVETSQTAQQGVATQSPSVDSGTSLIDRAFSLGAEAVASFGKDKGDAKLSEFSRQQMKVADAYAQGKIGSSAEARSRLRLNLQNAMEDAGDDIEFIRSLMEVQREILGTGGGGSVISERTDSENRQKALWDSMVSSGYVSADATEGQLRDAATDFQKSQEAARIYDLEMQNLRMKKAKMEMNSAEARAVSAQQASATRNFLTTTNQSELRGWNAELMNIHQSDASPADKKLAINQAWSRYAEESTVYLQHLSSDERTMFMAPFQHIRDAWLDRVDTGADAKDLQNELDILMRNQQLLLMQDEDIAKSAAISKLIDPGVFGEQLKDMLAKPLFKFLADAQEGTVSPVFDGAKSTAQAFGEVIRRSSKATELGGEFEVEGVKQVDSLLDSMASDERQISKEASKGHNLIKELANPQFGEFVRKYGDQLENLDDAREVVTQHWYDEVLGMVEREFKNSGVVTPNVEPSTSLPFGSAALQFGDSGTPVPEAVTYRTTSAGMEFVAIDPNDTNAVAKARDLNGKLRQVINTTIQAASNLEGSTDYGQAWEGFAERLLGPKQETPADDSQDDLSLESFKSGESVLDQAMTTGGFVGDGDYSDAETAAEVAASFVGFHEGEERDVLSSFIKKATGNNINPETTAWCAAFVNSALGAVGKSGTGSNLAKSFLNWGKAVSNPTKGDIAIFDRGDQAWQGHVGFYVGPSDKEGYVRILGGNQNDTVSIKDYPLDKLRGFRRG